MMKALTHNIRQEREDQRDRSAQLFMWCIVVSMHQDDGIGASRLLRACNEMDAFEKKYQTAILYGSSKTATDAMRENLKGICDFEVRLPVDRAPSDGCNHCLGWEYGAHVIGYFKYCPYCGDRLEDGTEEET